MIYGTGIIQVLYDEAAGSISLRNCVTHLADYLLLRWKGHNLWPYIQRANERKHTCLLILWSLSHRMWYPLVSYFIPTFQIHLLHSSPRELCKGGSRLFALVLVLTCNGCSHDSSVTRQAWTRERIWCFSCSLINCSVTSFVQSMFTVTVLRVNWDARIPVQRLASIPFLHRQQSKPVARVTSAACIGESWARPHTNEPQPRARARARVIWSQLNKDETPKKKNTNTDEEGIWLLWNVGARLPPWRLSNSAQLSSFV